MLSIIICSINTGYLRNISENIENTAGIEYELLIWDNRKEQKGLCEVYNIMAPRARYPYICFLHEDILFNTAGWGKLLLDVFKYHPSVGLIGVAGSTYKSSMYSGWYSGSKDLDYFNIIHRHRNHGTDIHMRQPADGDINAIRKVVCIDGVIMVCRKEIWEKTRFDDQLLKGFHFYDIDFSLRAAGICEVAVLMNIDIVHITLGGDFGQRWVNEAILFHQERKSLLPSYLNPPAVGRRLDIQIAAQWLDWLKSQDIRFPLKLKWIRDQRLYKWSVLWYQIIKLLIYRPLGLNRIHQLFKKDNPVS